jgi:hypothetical protein
VTCSAPCNRPASPGPPGQPLDEGLSVVAGDSRTTPRRARSSRATSFQTIMHERINTVRCPDQLGHYVGMTPKPEDAGLTTGRGKWILPIGDGTVTQIRIDYAFTLVLEAWIDIRIETPFTYGAGDDTRRFEPADAPAMAPLLALHQSAVTSAEIRKDGRLTLVFADGAVLMVPPDEQYEAFTVAGSLPSLRRGFHFVAIPGGGLARF